MIPDKEYLSLLGDTFDGFKFHKVESTNVFAYAYNKNSQTLIVAFKGGKIYSYSKVPPALFNALQASESKGHFISVNIVKNQNFKFRKYEIQEP